jgi:ADP-heptose:LPS heptosyltransferase
LFEQKIRSHLDLVIAVDTAAVHLAGAMGKKVWVMLPYAPDRRWLLGRNDSPWYPTARLFRQSAERRWQPVIDDIMGELASG